MIFMNLVELLIRNDKCIKYKIDDINEMKNRKYISQYSIICNKFCDDLYNNGKKLTYHSFFEKKLENVFFNIKNNLSNQAPVFCKKKLCLLDLSNSSRDQAKTDTHKRLPVSRYIVPRECYIRRHVDRFMQQMVPVVRGYNGMHPVSSAPASDRTATYQAVLPLPIVGGAVPDMKNGHITDVDQNGVRRCLTIRDREAGIVGAIYFRINFATRVCYVSGLGVAEAYHKNKRHFGQTLLQCAIVIARVYACQKVELSSVPAAVSFYRGQGFMQTSYLHEFNFQNVVSLDRFSAKTRDAAPHFSLQSLACEVDAKRKEAHLSLS